MYVFNFHVSRAMHPKIFNIVMSTIYDIMHERWEGMDFNSDAPLISQDLPSTISALPRLKELNIA